VSQGVDAATAKLRAIAQLSGLIEKHALVMTYCDCFWIMGVLILATTPIVFLLRRPKNGTADTARAALDAAH
jgi:MFS transporter, DHA2 family, multidrug resistance protein